MTKLTQDDQVPNDHQQSTFPCFYHFYSYQLPFVATFSFFQLYKEWKFTYIVPLSYKKFCKLITFLIVFFVSTISYQ
jgi:hypothetical protein